VHDGFEQRVTRILHDYVIDQCAARVAALGHEPGFADFSTWLQDSLTRLAKRLGGDRLHKLLASMQRALEQQGRNGDVSMHRDWIADLLSQYYDPMYTYQRSQRTTSVEFEGSREEVLAHLRARAH
jgi:tRNA 2-selenouridine synthase